MLIPEPKTVLLWRRYGGGIFKRKSKLKTNEVESIFLVGRIAIFISYFFKIISKKIDEPFFMPWIKYDPVFREGRVNVPSNS